MRLISCALIVAVILLPLLHCCAQVNDHSVQDQTAKFPSALLSVGEEAFEGTSFRTLVFEDGLLSIHDRAFSNMKQLKLACFPDSVEYIADSAFFRSGLKVIRGRYDSYAQRWAERQQMRFEAEDRWHIAATDMQRFAGILAVLLGFFSLPMGEDTKRIKRYLSLLEISMRPQDRPELYPIDYRFP